MIVKINDLDINNWNQYSLKTMIDIFSNCNFNWYLAGGHALDLYIGFKTREHSDIDILIDIHDIQILVSYLSNFTFYIARNGELIEYNNKILKPSDSLWVTEKNNAFFVFEVLIFESHNSCWTYKRNNEIKLDINQIFFFKNNIKVLNPEIQLLYKVDNLKLREKDILDVKNIFYVLGDNQKKWLIKSSKEKKWQKYIL